MQNQNEVAAPREMLHLQVAGNLSQEEMVSLLTQFQATWKDSGVIATTNNVVSNVISPTTELAGMILTPKLTAVEIAEVAVEVLRGFDVGQGNEVATPPFAELSQDAQNQFLNVIQCILRFGGLPPTDADIDGKTRDALVASVVHALGQKLVFPSTENLINVTKVAQKEGDEDFEVSFKDLVAGDVFKHGEGTFVAKSNPYVNWIANPLPIVTIDAATYQAPEPVAPEDVKTSKPSKKKVQSKASNSTAKTRKK